MNPTRELKNHALAEGFDLVGVAAAGAAESAGRLTDWIVRGFQGGMDYMADTTTQRSNPEHLLADCRSLVMVAMSYRSSRPDSDSRPPDDRVWISRYAWGRDYHRLVKKRLVRLGRWLEDRHPGCGWRAVVDTAPLLEREWAARAGLGWVGKSSMLINRRLGSELFLGALLTDVVLDSDDSVTDHCGTCTACLDACPTGALLEPRVLDARRCIGYLTVEHRGEIPPELAPHMGDMVAGCDRCNEVCPWTRKAPADLHAELGPAQHRFRPRLEDLQALDEMGWREWRRGSPLGRIPFGQLQRSLAAVERNNPDSKSLESENSPLEIKKIRKSSN